MLDSAKSYAEAKQPVEIDAVIVGAGFAGVYMLHKLRNLGVSVRVLEAAAGIGGTWYHNRYPGARCDIESMDYSYSFSDDLQQEWHWSERYASQPEILSYINHVADRFDLWPDISLKNAVTSARYDEPINRWTVATAQGDVYLATFCIMATGVLSAAQVPDIPGLDQFHGTWYHTGAWPHREVNFAGKKVGVIGTGSSGTQLIPLVAAQADELVVFQRTANYCMPAQNRPMEPEVERTWKAEYAERRRYARASGFGHNQLSNDKRGSEVSKEEREQEFERRWQLGGLYMLRAFTDITTDEETNKAAIEFVDKKIDGLVRDPMTAAVLKPKNIFLGTKRLSSGTNYYETFNRKNVRMVDVKSDPIEAVTTNGISTQSSNYDLDVLIFATGFDAMTGSILRIDPVGLRGQPLSEKWSHGPCTYLGLAVSGFPNMFIIAGAGSPSVFSNMVTSIEQHVEWIANCIEFLRKNSFDRIEAEFNAETQWVEHVNELVQGTLHRHSKRSWFYGANTPGKPVVFMPYLGGVGRYAKTIGTIESDGYTGFSLASTAARSQAPQGASAEAAGRSNGK